MTNWFDLFKMVRLFYFSYIFLFLLHTQEPFVMGIQAEYEKKMNLENYSRFKHYLETLLKHKIALKTAITDSQFVDHLIENHYDLFFMSPLDYVKARLKNNNLEPLLLVLVQDKPYYQLNFYVQKNSKMDHIRDINNKSIGLGFNRNPSENLIPRFILEKYLVEPKVLKSDLSETDRMTHLKHKLIDVYVSQVEHDSNHPEFKSIYTSVKFPRFILGYHKKRVNSAQLRQIEEGLIELPSRNIAILKQINSSYTGFTGCQLYNLKILIQIARYREKVEK